MKILIIGAGHTALKLITLLNIHRKNLEKFQDVNITVISANEKFVFLPLVVNYIDGSLKDEPTVDLESISKIYRFEYINQEITHRECQDEKENEIGANGNIIIDTRNSMIGNECNHIKYSNILRRIEEKDYKELTIGPSLDGLEMALSIISTKGEKINGHNLVLETNNQKRLSTHPVFNTIMKKRIHVSFKDKLDAIKTRTVNVKENKEKMVEGHKSAQYASFKAKMLYKGIEDLIVGSEKALKIDEIEKKYKKRGEMYYMGYKNGYIETNRFVKIRLSGYIASQARRRYYQLQNRLFYQYENSLRQKILWFMYKLYFRIWIEVKRRWAANE